jgi:hypothetical protein
MMKLNQRFKEARKLEEKMLNYRSVYKKVAIIAFRLREIPEILISIQDLQSEILEKLQKQKVRNVSYVSKFNII